MRSIVLLVVAVCCLDLCPRAYAQDTIQTPPPTLTPTSLPSPKVPQDTSKRDSLEQLTSASVPAGNSQSMAPRSSSYYSIVKPGTITRKGLFSVHKLEDK